MSYTIVTDPVASPVIRGDSDKIYLTSRNARSDGERLQTVDVYVGPAALVMAAVEDFRANPLVASADTSSRQAGNKALTVIWNISPSQIDDPLAAEEPVWRVTPVQIIQPLAAHPYFQRAYKAEAGVVISDMIAIADNKISRGIEFVAASAYKEITSRYYGLRVAGVDGFPVHGVTVSKSFHTSSAAAITAAAAGQLMVTNQAGLNAPAFVVNAISKLPRIDSYNTDLPSSYIMQEAVFKYLKQPLQVSGPEGGPWQVTEEWLGLDDFSAVLYPGGAWDPQGRMA